LINQSFLWETTKQSVRDPLAEMLRVGATIATLCWQEAPYCIAQPVGSRLQLPKSAAFRLSDLTTGDVDSFTIACAGLRGGGRYAGGGRWAAGGYRGGRWVAGGYRGGYYDGGYRSLLGCCSGWRRLLLPAYRPVLQAERASPIKLTALKAPRTRAPGSARGSFGVRKNVSIAYSARLGTDG